MGGNRHSFLWLQLFPTNTVPQAFQVVKPNPHATRIPHENLCIMVCTGRINPTLFLFNVHMSTVRLALAVWPGESETTIQVSFLGISPALSLWTLKINTSELSTVDPSNLNIFVRASLVSNWTRLLYLGAHAGGGPNYSGIHYTKNESSRNSNDTPVFIRSTSLVYIMFVMILRWPGLDYPCNAERYS